MKTKGLPFQPVEFHSVVSSIRLYAEDCMLTKTEKLAKIEEMKDKLIHMTEENCVFWARQATDGEFSKKS